MQENENTSRVQEFLNGLGGRWLDSRKKDTPVPQIILTLHDPWEYEEIMESLGHLTKFVEEHQNLVIEFELLDDDL
ncbi:unnamed protein product [Ambrosiozyma monospora]|nr:unnamed protein product [Ambrosiozyma monospora]